MTCKDNVDNWMSTLATSSNIKYNMESGGRSRTGKRVSFIRWYIIMPVQTKKADQKKQKAAKKTPIYMYTGLSRSDVVFYSVSCLKLLVNGETAGVSGLITR